MAIVRTLLTRDRLLTVTALAMLAGALVVAGVAPFDGRVITGVNPWIKPLKFLVSIALFLATMAWLMPEVDAPQRVRQRLSRVFAGAMIIEIVCIAGQAARGTTSHFNYATGFDAAIFQIMGLAITVNTIAAAVMLRRLRRDTPAGRAGYLLGVRLGLALFVLGSLQGFLMVANLGHAVPGPDGGPGLPFVNWSLDRGDLRIAHFVGLHALQALALLGFVLDRTGAISPAFRRVVVGAIGVAWAGVMGATLVLALRGLPLLAQ
jgi:hypothetical protein